MMGLGGGADDLHALGDGDPEDGVRLGGMTVSGALDGMGSGRNLMAAERRLLVLRRMLPAIAGVGRGDGRHHGRAAVHGGRVV